jgi:uncharacterized protein with PIN domain
MNQDDKPENARCPVCNSKNIVIRQEHHTSGSGDGYCDGYGYTEAWFECEDCSEYSTNPEHFLQNKIEIEVN